jgi:hypothetical protein
MHPRIMSRDLNFRVQTGLDSARRAGANRYRDGARGGKFNLLLYLGDPVLTPDHHGLL